MLVAKRFMPFVGTATGRMNAAYLRNLARQSKFADSKCMGLIPDAEAIRLSIVDGATTHVVECSLGASNSAPVADLVEAIHRAAMQVTWKGESK